MKNLRNVCLALIIPFGVSALAFAASSIIIRPVERDITDIEWSYRDMEGYSMLAGRQPLEASAVYDEKYPLSAGNELVWSVINPEGKSVGEIQQDATGQYYFNPLAVGDCTVVCANAKGNVNRSFTARVFARGAIIANPTTATSGHSISGIFRFGMYDYARDAEGNNQGKVSAEGLLDIEVIGDAGGTDNLEVVDHSDNITSVILKDGKAHVSFAAPGRASITFKDTFLGDEEVDPLTYKFEIVDGVNIYSYADLMDATNRSETGESIVLRTNFGTLSDLYEMDEKTGRPVLEDGELVPLENPRENTVLFGDYDPATDTFTFDTDAYSLETTLQSPFIQAWNEHPREMAAVYPNYEPYDETVYAGINLKGDLYGNGFTIDMHNLTFPYQVEYRTDEDGNQFSVIGLRDDNLFRGPQTYFAYGDPHMETSPIVAFLGQDNVGLLVQNDGTNICDVQIENCDVGDNLENLRYTGTVCDIEAADVTIVDSVLSNGRNIVRAYSAPGLTIDNSLLHTSYEYLLRVGSNELASPTGSEQLTYNPGVEGIPSYPSNSAMGTLNGFDRVLGDDILNSYLTKDAELSDILTLPLDGIISGPYGSTSASDMARILGEITHFYDASYKFQNSDGTYNYDSDVTVNDTMFYRSGLSSISLDQLPSGSYLWGQNPSNFTSVMSLIQQFNPNLIINPLGDAGFASRLSRSMQPSRVTIAGETEFYDWKDSRTLTINGGYSCNYSLLLDRVPSLATSTLDDFIPVVDRLVDGAYATEADGISYVNLPVIRQGGGVNHSTITFDEDSGAGIGSEYAADYVEEILTRDFTTLWPDTFSYSTMNLISHAISTFLGFAPYYAYSAGADYPIGVSDVPNLTDLQNRRLTK